MVWKMRGFHAAEIAVFDYFGPSRPDRAVSPSPNARPLLPVRNSILSSSVGFPNISVSKLIPLLPILFPMHGLGRLLCAFRGARALGGFQGRLPRSFPLQGALGDEPPAGALLADDVRVGGAFGPSCGPFRGRGRVVQAYDSRGKDAIFPFSPRAKGSRGISV